MARRKSIIILWLYLLLLKVKSDPARSVNMDTSALFHSDVFSEGSEYFHVGDLNIGESLKSDDDVDIVLTVGELVKMYNNEDTSDSDVKVISEENSGNQKFVRLTAGKDSKQTQSDITVDFKAVAGRSSNICWKIQLDRSFQLKKL